MSRNKQQWPTASEEASPSPSPTRSLIISLRPDHASILDNGTVVLHFEGVTALPVEPLIDFVTDLAPDMNELERKMLIDALVETWHDNTIAVVLRRALVK